MYSLNRVAISVALQGFGRVCGSSSGRAFEVTATREVVAYAEEVVLCLGASLSHLSHLGNALVWIWQVNSVLVVGAVWYYCVF